jgi:aryl-alcohol dehydrogenase-like predicted oxidoreductase
MRYRRVGATELVVSEIGFGSGGNAGLMVRGTRREQDDTVAHALDRGVTYFDTAPDYGNGVAETNLGRALRACGGAQAVITTKVEIRAENLPDIAAHIGRSVEESLKRLQRDQVDVVQIHNGPVATAPDLQGRSYKTLGLGDFFRPDGVLEGLDHVIESGKARYAGFVCRGNDRAEVTQLLQTKKFSLLNLPYTLLNPSAGRSSAQSPWDPNYDDVISLAASFGSGVAVFSPLAGGLLTPMVLDGNAHPLARPKDVEALQAKGHWQEAREFALLADEFDISIVELAYRFIVDHEFVTTIAAGISSRDQIDQIANLPPDQLPAELNGRIEAIWRRHT